MAEAVGLVASLITIAGAGGKLALGFYEISSSLRSARREARGLAREISVLSNVLKTLSTHLEIETLGSYPRAHPRDLAHQLVIMCEEELEYMQHLLQDLSQLVKEGKADLHRFAQRLRWLFRKAKLQYHKTSIEALKSDLLLLLSTLQYARGVSEKAPATILTSLGTELQCQQRSADKTISDFTESFDEDLREGASENEAEAYVNFGVTEAHQQPIPLSLTQQEDSAGDDERVLSLISSTVDIDDTKSTQFSALVPQVNEHLQLQRDVQRFARSILLNGSTSDHTWTWSSSRDSTSTSAPGTQTASTAASSTSPTADSSHLTPEPTPGTTRSHSPAESSPHLTPKPAPKETDFDSARTPEPAADNISAEPTQALSSASAQKLINDLQKFISFNPPDDDMQPPIKFKDAVGRKFSFPWKHSKTWKGMHDLIQQAFEHVDGLGDHVAAGHYDLVGPDGEIILPRIWEMVVKPDWAITMHMWPMPEEDTKPTGNEAGDRRGEADEIRSEDEEAPGNEGEEATPTSGRFSGRFLSSVKQFLTK